jgi:hypothetical protein
MSCDFVDMDQLGVGIPVSFKRMAELQSIHRDATSGDLDIQQYAFAGCIAGGDLPVIAIIIKSPISYHSLRADGGVGNGTRQTVSGLDRRVESGIST